MKVGDLRQGLDSLCQFLELSGARQGASEWRRVNAALEPFAEMTSAQFCDFLARAEEYHRTGVIAGRARGAAASRSKPVDPEKLAKAKEDLKRFYESVAQHDVTYEEIDRVVKRLDRDFSAAEVRELAKTFDMNDPPKTKKATLEEISRRIKGRKETAERANF